MDKLLILVFFILMGYIIIESFKGKKILVDNSTHDKPVHLLRDILNEFSSGDKINLVGDCTVNLYTKLTAPVEMKDKFKNLLNQVFNDIYGLTHHIYKVQEINNVYEQLDSMNNSRYIVDATLNSTENYYSVKVVLDIIKLRDEIFVNYINLNNASNNNIINRYDIVYQDQGILLNTENFTKDVKSLLDNIYEKYHRVVTINSKTMDGENYPTENVLSLSNLLNNYYPATTSNKTVQNFEMKGVSGLIEQYFPDDLKTINSPQYCYNDKCIINHNSTMTEYTQPYMAPGLFFDRSSYPIN